MVWYLEAYLGLCFSFFLKPPVSTRRIARISEDSNVRRYSYVYKIWDRLREGTLVLVLSPIGRHIREVLENRIFRFL